MTRATTALALLLWVARLAPAQDMLSINQPIEREIVAGTAHAYTILLNAGDYVAGSVDQRGIAVLAVAVLPDGSRFRGFPGPPTGKRPFAFIAETPGLYRLELRAPTQAEAAQNGAQQAAKGSYEVRVIEKIAYLSGDGPVEAVLRLVELGQDKSESLLGQLQLGGRDPTASAIGKADRRSTRTANTHS